LTFAIIIIGWRFIGSWLKASLALAAGRVGLALSQVLFNRPPLRWGVFVWLSEINRQELQAEFN